jgi:signal transduction histidine kinase/CheY-like chemotaxis protein
MFALAGLDPDAFDGDIQKTIHRMIHPDDRESVLRQVAEMVEQKRTWPLEFRILRPDNGEVRWVRSGSRFVFDDDGVPVRCIGVHQDITERQRMEQALKESEEKYRSMMEAMDECAFICSSDFRIEYMNPAMKRKTGRDATGEICYRAFHGLGDRCPWCQQEKVLKGETIKSELVKSESGEAYLISQSPVFHTNGTVSKLAVYRDITELKKLEARVQQAQKMEAIGNLAGGIAHDFNNILSPLIGYAELLLEELPPGGFEYESAQEILKAGKRGGDLVRQILSVGRKSEPGKKPVRIQQVLNDVLKLTRSTIPSNIEMEHDIQKDCGTVMADPTQLHQIAMNLVTNANHAVEREENGKIYVELKETDLGPDDTGNLSVRPGRYARLTVSDNGCGIGPETMKKIFEPYFTTKEKGKGTGLGLAVVHGIVKGNGGDIRVYSEVGKGATFSVYLPLLEKMQDSPAEKVAVGYESGSESILMVDDEVQIVRLQRMTLERLGYRVTARASSVDALESFRADPEEFDLVLTDFSMPDMTGVQLAREIHAIRADIPVIVCTGFSERINRETAEGLGIRGFLTKPVAKADLAGTVRSVLDAAKKSGA